jgi:2-polyprenyl-3-methyl-5-hydroxy-6-metoxy-1,4-benzoquinol methylase
MSQNGSFQACRFCRRKLETLFVDLGMSPLSNSYLTRDQLNQMEAFYPLRVFICASCLLVQAEEFESPQSIFSNYAYFASYSDSWLQHAKTYAEMARERFGLDKGSKVVEIASNDGYLLQYFLAQGIPVLGVEPAQNVADVAIKKGIPTITKFFGVQTARELAAQGTQADLLLGNNVIAHVPDLNDFVYGMKLALKPGGVITMEFPHLMRLIQENQFDTIYHEHFSYFSFTAIERVFAAHGLTLFDVEELSTHGGSLRIYARHIEDTSRLVGRRVSDLRVQEEGAGLASLEGYRRFGENVKKTKFKAS